MNPMLWLAAHWHTNDVLNNRDLDGDIGSDGSTVHTGFATPGSPLAQDVLAMARPTVA
jgi:hypothetical protein